MNRHVCLQREESPVEQVTQADVDRVVRRSQARWQPTRLAAHAGDLRSLLHMGSLLGNPICRLALSVVSSCILSLAHGEDTDWPVYLVGK